MGWGVPDRRQLIIQDRLVGRTEDSESSKRGSNPCPGTLITYRWASIPTVEKAGLEPVQSGFESQGAHRRHYRLTVRTDASQASNQGSIPCSATTRIRLLVGPGTFNPQKAVRFCYARPGPVVLVATLLFCNQESGVRFPTGPHGVSPIPTVNARRTDCHESH